MLEIAGGIVIAVAILFGIVMSFLLFIAIIEEAKKPAPPRTQTKVEPQARVRILLALNIIAYTLFFEATNRPNEQQAKQSLTQRAYHESVPGLSAN